MSMKKIQSEVNAVRVDRRANALGKPNDKHA